MPPTETVPTNFKKFFLLEKYDAFQGIASGIATAEAVDRDKEILDYAKSKPYFEAWSDSVHKDSGGKSYGNLRFQHDDKKVAGKLNSIEFNDEAKLIRVEAKVVDPIAKDMLEQGCLTGFSIGGRYVDKSSPDKDGVVRYVADPCEISVVDRPALPGAVFQSVKADGSFELRKFAKYEKAEGESFSDIEACIQAALNSKYAAGNNRWIWIRDTFKDSVVYCINDAGGSLNGGNKLYECSYEIKGDDCTLGDPSEVKETYVPADKAATPDVSKAIADAISAMKSGDIETLNEINRVLKSLDEEVRKMTMADQKETLVLDKAARHSIAQKVQAAKAHVDSHLEHCAKACKAMHGHLDGISKVMGGGAESTTEGGEAEHVTEGKPGGSAPQAPGASETADKATYISIGKDANGVELFKRVEADRPLTLKDLNEFGKNIARAVLDVQKSAVDAIGDRTKVKSFVKAVAKEDDGTPTGGDDAAKGGREQMTPEDWKAYSAGDRNAIAKAQRCTAQKWQPVPSRIMNRDAARVGSN